MKKRKFPKDVARFFNPQKTASTAEFNKFGVMTKPSINQQRKMKEKSSIPVYYGGGTAKKVVDYNGRVSYK